MASVWRTLAAGGVATLALDLLSVAASRLGLSAALPPTLIGRWFASIARGRIAHADIAQAPAVAHEMAIAVAGHYAIGIALTALYVWVISSAGRSPRSLTLALAFALCTNLLPWLLMFPSMGYGFFGAHGPAGTRLFFTSLLNHFLFGIGVWLGVVFSRIR